MNPNRIEVIVDAGPGTEFVISDARRVKVFGSAGYRKFSLPAGFYKVRFMVGGRSADQLFEVETEPVTLRAPKFEITSPIPLELSSSTHEYQQDAARKLSTIPATVLGEGSELAFLVRDSRKEWQVGPPAEPWHGLMLQRLVGITDVDFTTDGLRDGERGFAAVRVRVNPETFLLTLVRKSGAPLQLPVTATPGWRTTVYLDCTGKEGEREPDLYGASVVISGLGDSFYPEDPVLELAERAKLSIQRGRATVDAASLSKMMNQKFVYPMLGILAAHVLLLEKKPDVEALGTILKNLNTLMPGHPDVLALHCGLERHVSHHKLDGMQLSGPPMLRNSWDLLVEASDRYPELLPVNAEWMQYAYGLSGSRVWMVWQRPPAERQVGTTLAEPALKSLSGRASWTAGLESVLQYALKDKPPSEALASLMNRAKTVLASDKGQLNRKDLAATWRSLQDALRDPSIARNPLQSALRRKLLSLLEEDDFDQDLALTINSLAKDFRVPTGVLIQAASSLFIAAQDRVPPDSGK
jgi:hypothetical protein